MLLKPSVRPSVADAPTDTFSEANGYELSFVDADNDNAVQLEAVRTFIQQEMDYICIAPIDYRSDILLR